MPRFVRLIAPVVAALAIALGGASAALAAAPDKLSLDAEWCFDDSPAYAYCFEIDGHAIFGSTQAGSSVTVNERFHTTVYEGGLVVGESTEVSLLRSVSKSDGSFAVQEVSHVRSVVGDETCAITIVWRQADYELVVDHWSGGCA